MATKVVVDVAEVKEFVGKLQTLAKGDFKKELETWMEGIGEEFLRVAKDEIINLSVVDSRDLLISFNRGGPGNVWEMSDGGTTLKVGSAVEYAGYVEYGHTQQPGRFIPGYWQGKHFIYQPGYPGGMVLRKNFVDGKHYFERSLQIFDSMFKKLVEVKMNEWIEKYLNF